MKTIILSFQGQISLPHKAIFFKRDESEVSEVNTLYIIQDQT